MKKMIVLTDFSPFALHAATYAIQLAIETKASIHFLHVADYYVSPFQGQAGNESRRISSLASAEMQMNRFTQRLPLLRSGVRYEKTCVSGNLPEKVAEHARGTRSELIVLSGSRRYARILGSKIEAILTASPVPVLVVPAGAMNFSTKKILFLTSEKSERDGIETLSSIFPNNRTIQTADVHCVINDLKAAANPYLSIAVKQECWRDSDLVVMSADTGIDVISNILRNAAMNRAKPTVVLCNDRARRNFASSKVKNRILL